MGSVERKERGLGVLEIFKYFNIFHYLCLCLSKNVLPMSANCTRVQLYNFHLYLVNKWPLQASTRSNARQEEELKKNYFSATPCREVSVRSGEGRKPAAAAVWLLELSTEQLNYFPQLSSHERPELNLYSQLPNFPFPQLYLPLPFSLIPHLLLILGDGLRPPLPKISEVFMP